MYSGKRGNYKWMESAHFGIADVIKKCPEVFLSKYLVITSFDSGPLLPTEKELEQGWSTFKKTLCSPVLTKIDELPFDNYDEWYIFKEYTHIDTPEIFVNYGTFNLRDPKYLRENIDPTWNLSAIEAEMTNLNELQQRFWLQIEKVNPESFICEGDNFIFVTQNTVLFESIQKALTDCNLLL